MIKTAMIGLLSLASFNLKADECTKYPPKRDWIAELRGGVFLPTSDKIQKIYGHGWIEGEAEFTYRFKGCWGIWGNAGYSYKNGHPKDHHNGHIQITPVSSGLKAIFFFSHHIRPYLGIGPSYTFLHLKNFSPLIRQRAYKNRFGFVAKSGIYFDLPKHFALDLFFDYYYQHMHFQLLKVNVAGFRTGIGLGYRF